MKTALFNSLMSTSLGRGTVSTVIYCNTFPLGMQFTNERVRVHHKRNNLSESKVATREFSLGEFVNERQTHLAKIKVRVIMLMVE